MYNSKFMGQMHPDPEQLMLEESISVKVVSINWKGCGDRVRPAYLTSGRDDE